MGLWQLDEVGGEHEDGAMAPSAPFNTPQCLLCILQPSHPHCTAQTKKQKIVYKPLGVHRNN